MLRLDFSTSVTSHSTASPNDLTFHQTNLLLHQQENILNSMVFLRDLLAGDLCKARL